jgi:DNA-binding MarR family transcriptional regulator
MRGAKVLSRRIDGRLGSLHGISFADFAILLQLGRAPGGRLRRIDLAEQLGLTASAVTRALIPLEKIGMVSRESDSSDARVSYASLTVAGRRVLEESLESAEMLSREIVPEDEPVTECNRIFDRLLAR